MAAKVQSSIDGKEGNILTGLEKWLTYDTRFPERVGENGLFSSVGVEKDTSAGTLPCKQQLHVLPTPAWFPDSYIRSQKANLYLKMLNPESLGIERDGVLEFYTEGSGDFMGMLKNMGKSALTLVSNQVGAMANTAQGLAEGVANAFGESTYGNETTTDPFLDNQPYVKVYGINPTPDLAENIEIVRQAWNIIKSVLNTDNGFKDFADNMWKALLQAIGDFLSPSGESMKINSKEDLWTKISSLDEREHSLAERLMTNSTPGTYLQFVKLPYVRGVQTFADCQGTWTGGMGKQEQGMLGEAVQNFTGMQIGSVQKMKWTPGDLTQRTPIQLKFRIYNDTLEHLVVNFFFVLGFTAGAKATTDTIFIRPPYLYDVEVPGGGRFRLCTCTCGFTPVGKMRRVEWPKSIAMNSPWGIGNLMSIAGDDELYFPDAWDVSISFKSQLPDSWNLMSSYFFGKRDTSPKLGATVHNILGKFMGSFADALSKNETASKEAAAAKNGNGAQ